VGGKLCCPPEDCGGAHGFAELLQALQDANHPRHDEVSDWLGDFVPYLCAGLLASVFLFLLRVSGSLVAFENEINRALNPRLTWVEPRTQRISVAEMKARLPVSKKPIPDIPSSDWASAKSTSLPYPFAY